MATPFLGSEEYDERAHRLYDDGEYEAALDTLKEGIQTYPDSVELYIGLGYTRLAREEFAWARHAFERALQLDADHEEAHAGLGEVLLRFGESARALAAFQTARHQSGNEPELMLSIGRALYRAEMFAEAAELFRSLARENPGRAEAAAALGYALHRLGEEAKARRELRRALRLDPGMHDARVYLGHLLYDRGDWDGALREFERVPPDEQWDSLAIERTIELRRAIDGALSDGVEVTALISRLAELDAPPDPVDALLAEIVDPEPGSGRAVSSDPGPHMIRLADGALLSGTWLEIVSQIRDRTNSRADTVEAFMRERAEEERGRGHGDWPVDSAGEFVRAGAAAGYWRVEY